MKAVGRDVGVMDKGILEALHFELRNLLKEINVYRESGDYVYTTTYKNWLARFNNVLKKYDAIKEWNVEPIRSRVRFVIDKEDSKRGGRKYVPELR